MSQAIADRLRSAGLPRLPRTAWLEIDLDRLAANLAAVRAALPNGVRLDPVVKADAYGHGASAVATWLEHRGADGFSVATLDEGLALREARVTAPVLVLFPIPADGAIEAAAARLGVTIGDRALLDRMLVALGGASDRRSPGLPLKVQVEVETGLGRGGIAPSELGSVLRLIAATPTLELEGLWSHLAAPDDVPRSAGQAEIFRGAVDSAIAAIDPAGIGQPIRHLISTGGLLAASAPVHDSCRLGLGLYGVVPDELGSIRDALPLAGALEPVMSLHTHPVRVADLPSGHGVSYGPTFVTTRPSRIATLPVGYGDGWSRALSNRAEAIVRGRRVPLVGNVAMDAVMADVTDLPGRPVTIDDEFVLLGSQSGELGSDEIAAAELAQLRNTNSWEVVTQMARRLPRVYHASAVPVGLRTLTEETHLWLPKSSSGTGISVTSRSTPS